MAKVAKKFESWQPPAGLTVEGNWSDGGATGFILVSTDDYSLVAELMGQFSEILSYAVHPVIPSEQVAPAALRGVEWAMK